MLFKLLIGLALCAVLLVAAVFAGPVSSGALLLLTPTLRSRAEHDLPASYVALHKGHVSLDNGVYYRENEDLIVRSTPPLVLRRLASATIANSSADTGCKSPTTRPAGSRTSSGS